MMLPIAASAQDAFRPAQCQPTSDLGDLALLEIERATNLGVFLWADAKAECHPAPLRLRHGLPSHAYRLCATRKRSHKKVKNMATATLTRAEYVATKLATDISGGIVLKAADKTRRTTGKEATEELLLQAEEILATLARTAKLVSGHCSDFMCRVGPDGCCVECHAYHGDPCPDCGGRAYHSTDCVEMAQPEPEPARRRARDGSSEHDDGRDHGVMR